MADLAAAVAGWSPDPVTATARVGDEPARAFAALLDQPAPATGPGDPLPLGWHWFLFLDRPATADLGPDGHPLAGHFLPPVPDRRRMFAGGRLRATAPLRVGDRITRTTAVASMEPKRGRSGEMLFVTVRSEFRREEELLLVEEQDVVYRSEPAADRPRPAPAPAPPSPAAPLPPPAADEPAVDLLPDPPMLFRFSALTYNAHRIHYDFPYATGVEGYPGLVVHGPLLALLLLEVPRRHLPGRRVAAFDYRLTRPAFAGLPVRATGRPDGDEVQLSAASGTAAPSITGTAVLTTTPEDAR
jgi:3-methylfumaryl-CoA hydratase